MSSGKRIWTLLAVAAVSLAGASARAIAQKENPPGGIRIPPRGRIAAINDPTYVEASEAEIKPNSWVLGVVIDGQARAYSLNLLNTHEVVNDTIGDTNFAAVW